MAPTNMLQEKGKSIPMPVVWGTFGAVVIFAWIALALFIVPALLIAFPPPTPPSYERVASPDGSHVAIVGGKQCEIDRLDHLEAVWVSRPGAGENEWHPVLPWQGRTVSVHWESGDRLVVESLPAKPRTITWEGVTIEVRRAAGLGRD